MGKYTLIITAIWYLSDGGMKNYLHHILRHMHTLFVDHHHFLLF